MSEEVVSSLSEDGVDELPLAETSGMETSEELRRQAFAAVQELFDSGDIIKQLPQEKIPELKEWQESGSY